MVWETTVRLMALGWSAAFPLLVGALCMMLGLSFGHIFGLDHFYIPGLFEGFNKSLLISMWTMTILGSPMANVMFFQGFKQQRGRLGDHGGLLFSQQRRSAVSVS